MRLDGSDDVLRGALTGLALSSLAQMRDPELARAIPSLYGGTIRYRAEERGHEDWQTALETARRGLGDCEDLAAYRLAELWRDGEKHARIRVIAVNPHLRHIVVQRADGSLEDPSKKLGM
jgi:hypothetical protein